jgi:hypothetical protein
MTKITASEDYYLTFQVRFTVEAAVAIVMAIFPAATSGQCHKAFYGRTSRRGRISRNVCPWQAYPLACTIKVLRPSVSDAPNCGITYHCN